MKSQYLKIALILVAVAGGVFALRSQPSSSTTPTKNYDSYGNDGRYRLVVTQGSYGDREYVIDTQSGRVWHSALDQDKQIVVLASETYENIDHELSKIPNETAIGIVVNKAVPNVQVGLPK